MARREECGEDGKQKEGNGRTEGAYGVFDRDFDFDSREWGCSESGLTDLRLVRLRPKPAAGTRQENVATVVQLVEELARLVRHGRSRPSKGQEVGSFRGADHSLWGAGRRRVRR